MALYIVSYDLRNGAKESDYKQLHDVIKTFGSWAHIMYSTWIVDTTLTAKVMSDRIRGVYQPENHLVWKLTDADRSGWLDNESAEWLKNHFP